MHVRAYMYYVRIIVHNFVHVWGQRVKQYWLNLKLIWTFRTFELGSTFMTCVIEFPPNFSPPKVVIIIVDVNIVWIIKKLNWCIESYDTSRLILWPLPRKKHAKMSNWLYASIRDGIVSGLPCLRWSCVREKKQYGIDCSNLLCSRICFSPDRNRTFLDAFERQLGKHSREHKHQGQGHAARPNISSLPHVQLKDSSVMTGSTRSSQHCASV